MQLRTAATVQSSKLSNKKIQVTPDVANPNEYKVNLEVSLTIQDLLACATFLPKEKYRQLLQTIMDNNKIGGAGGATDTSK